MNMRTGVSCLVDSCENAFYGELDALMGMQLVLVKVVYSDTVRVGSWVAEVFALMGNQSD